MLFENFAFTSIGPSGIVTGLFASNKICKFEFKITSSFRAGGGGAVSDPGGRADVNAQSSSSLLALLLLFCCGRGGWYSCGCGCGELKAASGVDCWGVGVIEL